MSYGINAPPPAKVKYISKTTVQTGQPVPSSSGAAAQNKLNKGLVYLKDPTPTDRGGAHGAVPSSARGEGRITVREKPGQEIRMRKPNPAPTLLPTNPAERRKLVIEKPDDHANEHGGWSRQVEIEQLLSHPRNRLLTHLTHFLTHLSDNPCYPSSHHPHSPSLQPIYSSCRLTSGRGDRQYAPCSQPPRTRGTRARPASPCPGCSQSQREGKG